MLLNKLLKTQLSGILLCFLLTLPAWFLGQAFPIIGSPVFAIIIGIAIALFFPKITSNNKWSNGITFTSKKILQYSIILLGFQMNFYNIITVGKQSLLVMIFTLSVAFLTAFFVGKALHLPSALTTLIGVGTSICGGSAIAATAPVIQAEDEDISQAISTIFLFNIIAVFLFPMLGHALQMNDMQFGMWAGTAINDTSSVVAAGSSWSYAVGNDIALQFATIVKLTRTLMIVPITLILAIYTAKKSKQAGDTNFKFRKVFPWFIIFFVLVALLNTFVSIPLWLSTNLSQAGKFLIAMAMVAIGLKTNLKNLIAYGFKPIVLGISCWFMVSIVSLIVQKLMGI